MVTEHSVIYARAIALCKTAPRLLNSTAYILLSASASSDPPMDGHPHLLSRMRSPRCDPVAISTITAAQYHALILRIPSGHIRSFPVYRHHVHCQLKSSADATPPEASRNQLENADHFLTKAVYTSI